MYSCRSSACWINKGLNEIEAAEKVKDIQSTNGIVFYVTKYGEVEGRRLYTDRINRWQKTLDSKSTEEKADINLRKSPSIIGRMARGDSLEEATIGYLEFCKKMKSKTNQTWSKISQELFVRLDEQLTGTTYYQSKNYEYNIDNYRVDFYHKDSKTVVEFYGDFFHRNPAIFEATFNVMGYASEQKWKSDSVRIEEILMSALVNRVIIVWEYDFRIDPTSIVDGIVKQIGE
jgi:very-short-patch-repair endonuclease